MVNLNYNEVEHMVNRVIFLTRTGILLNETTEYLLENARLIVADKTPENVRVLATRVHGGRTEHLVVSKEGEQLKLSHILTLLMGSTYQKKK